MFNSHESNGENPERDTEAPGFLSDLRNSFNPRSIAESFCAPPPTGREWVVYMGRGLLEIEVITAEMLGGLALVDHLNNGNGINNWELLGFAVSPFILGPVNKFFLRRIGML